MRRHAPQAHAVRPLRAALGGRAERRRGVFAGDAWSRLDRVQELGDDGEAHTGCVNALSWSDDGGILLSGSDDRRICIWKPDTRPDPVSDSPHPLSLAGTIVTGHRANIFSARFLPNASVPTIVSCAGDGDVRVFDVEKLQSADGLAYARTRGALWGVEGPGVTVLKCHRDRTKRIATEASPFLFLTVSEDGSVRQHDLRRPHTCRSECPAPLFRAPPGVDLYSLSISPQAPHVFAVAGQTDVAYICDRRKPAHQTPGWGPHTHKASQVYCVRRLGLPDAEWEGVGSRTRVRSFRERHITCVRMSPDNPDEVICSFASHSTSLFSLADSPAESSARVRNNVVVPPNAGGNTLKAEKADKDKAEKKDEENHKRRRESDGSQPGSRQSRQRTAEGDEAQDRAAQFLRSPPRSPQLATTSEAAEAGPSAGAPAVAAADGSDPSRPKRGENRRLRAQMQSVADGIVQAWQDGDLSDSEWDEGSDEEIDLEEYLRARDAGDIEMDVDSDEGEPIIIGSDDEDEFESDSDEGSSPFYLRGALSSEGQFKDVDLLYPRRSFFGARNVETVKDCNFLGDASDKICSGSDDGNFFVWDKATGKLTGIWAGDRDIVNVMEQHPSLPVVSVSGIDNTVKMFAPVLHPPDPSYNRTSQSEAILRRNKGGAQPRRAQGPTIEDFIVTLMGRNVEGGERGDLSALWQSLGVVRGRRAGAAPDPDDEEEDDDDEEAEDDDDHRPGDPQCPTQ